jgi:hypothetical protein
MNKPSGNANVPPQLDAFHEFIRRADWQRVNQMIGNRAVAAEEFFAVIPKQVAELAVFLRTPLLYEAILARVPAVLRQSLEAAKSAADTHFVGIESHPATAEMIRRRAQTVGITSRKDDAVLTEFSGFEATPLWLESGEALVPAVTTTIRSAANKVLMRSTLDWDDLSFLAFVLVDLFKDELTRAGKMANSHAVHIANRAVIADRLSQMRSALDEVERLAPVLNIRRSTENTSTVDKSSITPSSAKAT